MLEIGARGRTGVRAIMIITVYNDNVTDGRNDYYYYHRHHRRIKTRVRTSRGVITRHREKRIKKHPPPGRSTERNP